MSGFAVGEAANDMHMTQLARTIELEIIPRLMLAHRTGSARQPRPADSSAAIGPDDVRDFARAVLSHDEDVAFGAVELWRIRVHSVEQIYLELLAPTARYLGDLWEDDLCSFTDVTVGLGRLQRVLRELSPALGRGVDHPVQGRRVLLLPCPGEQHTFGLVMVAEFFRLAGWDVTGGAWSTGADAAGMVAGEWFDAVGFSMGAEIHLKALTETIAAVRHATCNQHLVILVGGPLFLEHPDYVKTLGADAMTMDGRDAPALAERLISDVASQSDMRG
ncbi:MAG: cobalamin B12-binding domain-containing protein [Caldimonas sp.]